DWDVGFLTFDGGDLSYRGERAQFTLPRERIVAVGLVRGMPGWIAAPRIALRWRGEDGSEREFTLRVGDIGSVHALAAVNTALAEELRRSLSGAEDARELALPVGSPPEPAQVTSQDPWRAAGWRALPAL